jgi:His-Xaa-Ser system protein HxsD
VRKPLQDQARVQASQPFQFRDGSIQVDVDVRVYRVSAVQKTAYRFADKCAVVMGALGANSLAITLAFRPAIQEREALDVARLFFQDLLDQELREQIAGETSAVRALILAHAFSNTDLIRRE